MRRCLREHDGEAAEDPLGKVITQIESVISCLED